jgi:SAM-dependent methyltransferase
MGWLKRWRSKREEKRRFAEQSRSETFDWIYHSNKWGGESRSGKGSGLERSYRIRQKLPELFDSLEVESILDLPCGDHGWMATLDLAPYDYVGVDIVADLIEENRKRYPERHFEVIDVCKGPLPDRDLVICRDLLVHLSFADIEAALHNLLAVQGRYIMCTTFPEVTKNVDIVTGKHRKLNLRLPPFEWPEPLLQFDEGTETEQLHGKCQGVWRLPELAELRAERRN